jgi:hypothetical protein
MPPTKPPPNPERKLLPIPGDVGCAGVGWVIPGCCVGCVGRVVVVPCDDRELEPEVKPRLPELLPPPARALAKDSIPIKKMKKRVKITITVFHRRLTA